MLAHAGGWDEMLLTAVAVIAFVTYGALRGRGRRRARDPERGPCLYCGNVLGPKVERCPNCGFRAKRGSERNMAVDRLGARRPE